MMNVVSGRGVMDIVWCEGGGQLGLISQRVVDGMGDGECLWKTFGVVSSVPILSRPSTSPKNA
jgi:hypothetical protein